MAKKAKYYGEWSTATAQPIEGNNKEQMILLLKSMANTNRIPGGECRWRIRDIDGNIIAEGGTTRNGTRYRNL